MEKVVFGIVDTPADVELTVARLLAVGFAPRALGVLFDDRHGSHDFGFEHHTKAPEGALAGAALGAVLGASVGASMGLGVLVPPGLGALVAAGPALAALSCAAAVALVLSLAGAWIGRAVPEIQAKHYAGKVRRGSILVAVHVSQREELARAREVLRSVAADAVTSTGEAALPTPESQL
jgi:hypothetical protein